MLTSPCFWCTCLCKLLIECYFLQDNFASDAFFDMAGGLLQLYTNVMLVSNWLQILLHSLFWCQFISGIRHLWRFFCMIIHVPWQFSLKVNCQLKISFVSPFLICGSCLYIQKWHPQQQSISITDWHVDVDVYWMNFPSQHHNLGIEFA